jgi:hypothetical protein
MHSINYACQFPCSSILSALRIVYVVLVYTVGQSDQWSGVGYNVHLCVFRCVRCWVREYRSIFDRTVCRTVIPCQHYVTKQQQ